MVAVALQLICFAERARAADPEADARVHFEAGRKLYEGRQYSGAAKEFLAGYALSPKPLFLVNVAQAYRKLGLYDKAREMCGRFLVEAPLDDPSREYVVALVRELDSLIAQQRLAVPPPSEPVSGVWVAPPPPAPARRPLVKRAWFWATLAGAAAAVAVAVGLGVGLAPSRDPAPSVGRVNGN